MMFHSPFPSRWRRDPWSPNSCRRPAPGERRAGRHPASQATRERLACRIEDIELSNETLMRRQAQKMDEKRARDRRVYTYSFRCVRGLDARALEEKAARRD